MEEVEELKYLPPWRQLHKVAKTWLRGSIHTHSEIATILDLPYPSTMYYNAVGAARMELLVSHNKYIEVLEGPEWGKGYKIIYSTDHLKSSLGIFKQSRNKMRRAANVAIHTDLAELNDEERVRHMDYIARMSRVNALISNERKPLLQLSEGYESDIKG
jgi:hypothetical protein